MEQNFQTSFIPQKPIVKERATVAKPVSPLTVLGLLVIFTVLLAAGGLYFWKQIAAKQLKAMERDLTLAQQRFEPAKIAELQVLDQRLRVASEILANHVAITPIFEALEANTMKTVRFTRFNYSWPDENAPVKVVMSGQAVGYRSVALQSDIFAEKTKFIDPVFSNLTLDPAGNVLFDLEFSVDPSFINYRQILAEEAN